MVPNDTGHVTRRSPFAPAFAIINRNLPNQPTNQPTLHLYRNRAVHAARVITPDVIFLVLLPPLVFSAAAHANWHTFRRSIPGVAALAVPGVVVSAVTIAWLFKLMPHTKDWTMTQVHVLGGGAAIRLQAHVWASQKRLQRGHP